MVVVASMLVAEQAAPEIGGVSAPTDAEGDAHSDSEASSKFTKAGKGDQAKSQNGRATPQAAASSFEMLGQVVSLMSMSPQHRLLFLGDFEWLLRPPMVLGQCRLFQRNGQPFAFVAWAFVSDEVTGRLSVMPGRLRPDEWNCGKHPVIVNVVAPFGGAESCVSEITKMLQTSERLAT